MALRVLAPVVLLTALGGCASLGEPARDADGCIPAMALYQPGVGPGRAGMVIHIPRKCPSPPSMSPELMAALAAMIDARDEESNPPPAPASAEIAVRRGIEGLCGWFLGGEPYSLEGLRKAAFDAGYRRGSPVSFIPSMDMMQAPFIPVGFSAVPATAPGDEYGVVAFVTFDRPTCQLQVYGYRAEGEAAIAALEADGWRRVGEPELSGWSSVQRYYGGPGARPLTMVVTTVSRDDEGPGLDLVINILPGEQAGRGLPFSPPA